MPSSTASPGDPLGTVDPTERIDLLTNPLRLWGIAFELGLALAVIYLPPFQDLLHTAALGLDAWLSSHRSRSSCGAPTSSAAISSVGEIEGLSPLAVASVRAHRDEMDSTTKDVTGGVPEGVSPAFAVFGREASAHASAWMDATRALDNACALDPKTEALAYLAVLAVLRLDTGMPFHVARAKELGASRAEVISALLLGLQPAGHGVTACLPGALDAYDATSRSAAPSAT
jgi:alkylhydroperoxidase/carboxymuconolactone decarboxylase family protein YurZ